LNPILFYAPKDMGETLKKNQMEIS
jgi:hypothetical protein